MTFIRIALRWSPVRAQAGAHMHTHSYATHTHALHKVSAESSSLHNTANSWELYFTAWYKKKPSCKQTHKHTHKSLRVTKLRYFVHILSSSFLQCDFILNVLFSLSIVYFDSFCSFSSLENWAWIPDFWLQNCLNPQSCSTLHSFWRITGTWASAKIHTQTNHKVIRQYFGYLFCSTFFFFFYFFFSENVVTDVQYTQFWVWSQFK